MRASRLAALAEQAPPAVSVGDIGPRPRPAARPAPVPPGAWWNNIRRVWLVPGATGPALVDPQPPPPVFASEPADPHVPPAVEIFA